MVHGQMGVLKNLQPWERMEWWGSVTFFAMQLPNPTVNCKPLRPVASIVHENVDGQRVVLGRPLSLG